MRNLSTYKAIILLVFLIGLFTSIQANHTMTGELAVDVKGYNFKNNFESIEFLDTLALTPDSSRRNTNLSSHYLSLFFNGPFINENFASYSVRSKFNGSFFNSTSQNTFEDKFQKTTENMYLNPDLNNFYGKISLFPNRKFPMEIYHSQSNEHSIRYEANNRTDIELVDPASGVVRHYLEDKNSNGFSVYYNAHPNVKIQSTIKKDKSKNNRIYDFGANKDIYLRPIEERGTAFTSDIYDVTIVNDLPDASLEIIFDDLFTYLIEPNMSETIPLNSGTHIIEAASVPAIYNKIGRSQLIVNQDLTLRYSYIEPATPNDINQSLNAVNLNFTYDNNKRFKSNAFYEYSDQKEGFQQLATYLNNFNNSAIYKLADNSDLSSQTNITRNQTDVDTSSHQISKALLQSFTLNHLMHNGVLLNSMYSYNYNQSSNRIDSLTGVDTLTNENKFTKIDDILSSNTHIFSNKISIPNKSFYNHVLDLGANVNFLSDNTGYRNRQYTFDFKNNFSKRVGFVRFEPRNDTKYSTSHQEVTYKTDLASGGGIKTITSSSKEIESRFFLKTYVTNYHAIGDITTGLEYGYRKKFDEKGDDIKNRYVFDINIIKRFGKILKVSLLTTQEKELFTILTVDSLSSDLSLDKSRIDRKESYKIDITLTPWEDFTFSSGYMTITQTSTNDVNIDSLIVRGSNINKLTMSLDFKIPYINFPLKMFYTRDTRDIDPLKIVHPTNEYYDSSTKPKHNLDISFTTKISYQFRKISLVFSYEYKKEDISATEGYSIHEINGKITRRFGIF